MEEFLQCSICCINYDERIHVPRQLPCQHNLCSICLPYMKKQSSNGQEYIECPQCREVTSKSLTEIPRSLVLLQLIEATRASGVSSQKPDALHSTNRPIVPVRPPPPLPPMPAHLSSPIIPITPAPTSSSSQNTLNQNTSSHQSSTGWDYKKYLRNIFTEMDINNDGSITAVELQQALRLSQSSNEFSMKTVELLISKYDTDGDREISFHEFYDLFLSLNEEFESFLLMDTDGSGSIDLNELMTAIQAKGYNFSTKFFEGIMNEVVKRTGHDGIKFDNYIRIAARFDFLCQSYRKTPYFQKDNLETYLRKTFFQDFW